MRRFLGVLLVAPRDFDFARTIKVGDFEPRIGDWQAGATDFIAGPELLSIVSAFADSNENIITFSRILFCDP